MPYKESQQENNGRKPKVSPLFGLMWIEFAYSKVEKQQSTLKAKNFISLSTSLSHELSNIEDEYHSDFHSGSDESTGEETQPENLIDKEVEQVCQRLQERDGECVINPKDDIGEVKFLFMSSLDPSYIPIQKETSTKGKSKTQ